MPNNLDMMGFGSPGLPVRAGLNGAVRVDSSATSSAFEVAVNGALKAAVTRAGGFAISDAVQGTVTLTVSSGGLLSSGTLQTVGNVTFGNGWSTLSGAQNDGLTITHNSASTGGIILSPGSSNYVHIQRGTNAQTLYVDRSYTDASNYSWLKCGWNTTTAVIHAEGAGTGSDGSVAFNDAALATNATVGFVMIPSCAGTPSGTPADIPTGQIPMVWDSTNLKLYVYTGGAWKASAAGLTNTQVACSDEATAITTGTAKVAFRMVGARTLVGVRASLSTAQTSGSIFTVDINKNGTTVLSTKLTIDNTEKTSTTAAAAAVISVTSFADDDEVTIDVDQVGDGTAKGLKVTLLWG